MVKGRNQYVVPFTRERDHDDQTWPGDEDGRPLADAYSRIDAARDDMERLEAELREFTRQTLAMMAKGWSSRGNTFVVKLPPARLAHEGKVNDRIRLLCGRVTEHLRAALDYSVMKAAQQTTSRMKKRYVKFVIAKDERSFRQQAKTALKHVDEEVRNLVEGLQPYRGNQVLEFVRDESNTAKHRGLPTVQHSTQLTIILREDPHQKGTREEDGWWIFDAGRGHAYYTRAEQSRLTIRQKYDALTVFPICIDHVRSIINTFEYYLENGHMPR